MKLLGIARVSTEEQAGDNGAGLNRQHDAIQRVAEANDAKLIGIVNIVDVSGSDVGSSKEWLTQVLPVIADPDVHIAIDALDRLIRASNFAAFGVLAACQSTHTRIYTPAGTHDLARPDGVLVSGLLALIGGKEKAEIVRRSQAGKEAKRQRGQWVQSVDFLPRGIAYDRKTHTWSFTAEADGVREMFMMAAEGATQAEIGRRTGVPSQTIRSLLQNPIYDGRLVFASRSSGRMANSKHQKKIPRPADHVIDVRVYSERDQLVPHELWLSVQARLRESEHAHRRTREATAPSSCAMITTGRLTACRIASSYMTLGFRSVRLQTTRSQFSNLWTICVVMSPLSSIRWAATVSNPSVLQTGMITSSRSPFVARRVRLSDLPIGQITKQDFLVGS